jgi:hypothetical protein
MIKNALKAAARVCGYEIHKAQPLPTGQDWVIDARRLLVLPGLLWVRG